MATKRVLMIGLDGATFTLLRPMSQEGLLPFVTSMIRSGTAAQLMSTRNPLTPPAWTSMVTGVSPEAHGIYDFLRPTFMDDGSVYMNINDRRENRAESVFGMVSRAGLRATALNFFGFAPPPEGINGYTAAGFVPWKHLRHAMQPKDLFPKLKASTKYDWRHLAMDIGEEKKSVQGISQDENEDWIALQTARDAAWTEVTCELMGEDRTELTAVVLDGPDKMQHLFWRYLDESIDVSSEGARAGEVRAMCMGFYRRMDDNIRRMVEAAGPETNVIITSDHGFGPTSEIVFINEWLARHGYLTWADTAEDEEGTRLTADRLREHMGMIDWKRTTAFSPTPSSNAIFLKPEVGNGYGVSPDNYLQTVLKLRDELLEWRDPATGTPVVVGVELNKLRGKPYIGSCPDLTLTLRDGGFVSILAAKEVVAPRPVIEGTHRPEGIFVGYGPAFRKGEQIDPLDLLDMTPLMLTLLGLSVPRDLEGRVPIEALEPGVVVPQRGGATQAPGETASEGRSEPSAEEREALLSQMKKLGYMD